MRDPAAAQPPPEPRRGDGGARARGPRCSAPAGHEVEQYTLPPTEQLGLSRLRAGAQGGLERRGQPRRRGPDPRVPARRRARAHAVPAAVAGGVPHRARARRADGHHAAQLPLLVHRRHLPPRRRRSARTASGSRLKLRRAPAPLLPRQRRRQRRAHPRASRCTGGSGTFHQAVTRFLALTDFSRALLVRDGIPADKVVVKPNSVPDPGVDGAAGPARPAALRRLRRPADGHQGSRDHARRLAAVPSHGDLRLRIAGDGPLRPPRRGAQPRTIPRCRTWAGWRRPRSST